MLIYTNLGLGKDKYKLVNFIGTPGDKRNIKDLINKTYGEGNYIFSENIEATEEDMTLINLEENYGEIIDSKLTIKQFEQAE